MGYWTIAGNNIKIATRHVDRILKKRFKKKDKKHTCITIDDFKLLLSAYNNGSTRAHQTLIELTGCDFKRDFKGWTDWLEANRDRPREAWSLDCLEDYKIPIRGLPWAVFFEDLTYALMHEELIVRIHASELLHHYTGKSILFSSRAKEKTRLKQQKRWQSWLEAHSDELISEKTKLKEEPPEKCDVPGPRPTDSLCQEKPDDLDKDTRRRFLGRKAPDDMNNSEYSGHLWRKATTIRRTQMLHDSGIRSETGLASLFAVIAFIIPIILMMLFSGNPTQGINIKFDIAVIILFAGLVVFFFNLISSNLVASLILHTLAGGVLLMLAAVQASSIKLDSVCIMTYSGAIAAGLVCGVITSKRSLGSGLKIILSILPSIILLSFTGGWSAFAKSPMYAVISYFFIFPGVIFVVHTFGTVNNLRRILVVKLARKSQIGNLMAEAKISQDD